MHRPGSSVEWLSISQAEAKTLSKEKSALERETTATEAWATEAEEVRQVTLGELATAQA